MSILDKKLFLADLSEQLDAFLPGAQARRVLEAAGLALDGYDLTALRGEDGGPDDSDGLLRLFLDAKAIEGRSEKTIAHYRHVLGHLRRSLGLPIEYAKAKRDEAIRRIVGEENFVEFDRAYGAAYMDELMRIRVSQRAAEAAAREAQP